MKRGRQNRYSRRGPPEQTYKSDRTESNPLQGVEESQIVKAAGWHHKPNTLKLRKPRQNTPEHRLPDQNEETRPRHVGRILGWTQDAEMNPVATKRIDLIQKMINNKS